MGALLVLAWSGWLDNDRAATIAAVAAAVAAFGSWEATHRSSTTAEKSRETAERSYEAAVAAQATAESMAAVERERRHEELLPELEVEIRRPSAGTDRASLFVVLRGPSGLPGLDDITVDIRDDGLLRTASPGRPPTAQDIAKQIWGPLHFIPGIDGVADPGRTAWSNGPLEPGDAMRRDMRDTQPPFWMDYPQAAQHWCQDYEGKAVRLRIKCTRSGYEPWYLFKDVIITPAPEAAG